MLEALDQEDTILTKWWQPSILVLEFIDTVQDAYKRLINRTTSEKAIKEGRKDAVGKLQAIFGANLPS